MKDQLKLTENEFFDYIHYLLEFKGINGQEEAEIIKHNVAHIKEYLARKDVCLIKEIDEEKFHEKKNLYKPLLSLEDYDYMVAYHDNFDLKLMQAPDLKSVYVEMDVYGALFLEKPPKIPHIIDTSIRLSIDDLASMKFTANRCTFTREIQGRKALVERIVGERSVLNQLFNMYAYNGQVDFAKIISHCLAHPTPKFDDYYFFRDKTESADVDESLFLKRYFGLAKFHKPE